jgi:prepilin-type N-terminal cleavage/methylation domain-containing protein
MRKGFTLIELIVAIGVLAIFSSFVVAILNPFEQFKKAADSKRKSDLAQIQRALEAYYQDFGSYPQSSSYQIVYNSSALVWGSSWAPYMDVLPKDQDGSRSYIYVASGAQPQLYQIYASLDRGGKDPQACNQAGTSCPNVPAGVTCGDGVCNFGLSSPNTSP